MKIAIALVLVFVVFTGFAPCQPAPVAQAVVPRLIRFSGQVKGTSGTVGITFSLHKSQEDHAALWIETQSVPLDATGKYNVLLGATKAEGIPMDLFLSGEAQWLAIQVEGRPEQPRVLLVSVPYALKAAEAETLAGHAASEFVTNDKLSTAVQQQLLTQSTQPGSVFNTASGKLTANAVAAGPTNFTGNTTDQIVNVVQSNTTGVGLNATAPSIAVKGTSTATTGSVAGVRGTASSTGGFGVWGVALTTTGSPNGVRGTASSPNGVGVFGNGTSTTGASVGVKGMSVSTTGSAIVATETATTGNTTGILASVASPAGTAAVFRNSTGTGKILSLQQGASNTEVFGIDTGGNATFTGWLNAQDQSTGVTTVGAAVKGNSVYNNGVTGTTSSTSAYGVYASGPANALYAVSPGTAVLASSTGTNGMGVNASATGTGGIGVHGSGTMGVKGDSPVTGGTGVSGDAFTSAGSIGVYGNGETGMRANSSVSTASGIGLWTTGPTAIYGIGAQYGAWINATASGSYGVLTGGDAFGVYATAGNHNGSIGVYGAANFGVWGQGGTGVYGEGGSYGVHGAPSVTSGIGVFGDALSVTNGTGVYGNGTIGVRANSSVSDSSGYGVYATGPTALYGSGSNYGVSGEAFTGVYGTSSAAYGMGVEGVSSGANGAGVSGSGTNGEGLYGYDNAAGYGLLAGVADTTNGYAGWFNGNVEVDGKLSKASGSFKIDHPLDPANKYLYHSFVESPDMMNIYNGNVTTDARGVATIELPEWFEALNRDFRYQLTSIGQPAQAWVSQEVANHHFEIRTDKPNVRVSWQVTGIRQDAWANANRIEVEVNKPDNERGSYLHPELFGQPEEKGVLWSRHPEMMKRLKEFRQHPAHTAAQSSSSPSSINADKQ